MHRRSKGAGAFCIMIGAAMLLMSMGLSMVNGQMPEGLDLGKLFGGGTGQKLGQECSFSCKNGARPIAKEFHEPQSNGCGVPGFMVESKYGMTPCCHQHDICYHTCKVGSQRKKGQQICDEEFKQCMLNVCKESGLTGKDKAGCKEEANIMSGGVKMLGCSAYMSSQEEACECPALTSDELILGKLDKKHRKRLLTKFYSIHDPTKTEQDIDGILGKSKSKSKFIEICKLLAQKYGQDPVELVEDVKEEIKSEGRKESGKEKNEL